MLRGIIEESLIYGMEIAILINYLRPSPSFVKFIYYSTNKDTYLQKHHNYLTCSKNAHFP